MATKKKAKTKTKKRKATARKAPARKKVVTKKKIASKTKTTPKAKRPVSLKRTVTPKSTAPAAPPGMVRIGVITHYYNHLSVAILKLETGTLRVGDIIHVRGHTSDFAQPVESMEIDHVHVNEAGPGQSFGLRVKEHAREHDVVYKAKS